MPPELSVALRVVARARELGFDAGMHPTRSSVPSPTWHVRIHHAGGLVRLRVSDHKRPPSAVEKYGHVVDFVNVTDDEAVSRIERYLANLDTVEGVCPARIPDWFIDPPLTAIAA